jgi:hypothetical protein
VEQEAISGAARTLGGRGRGHKPGLRRLRSGPAPTPRRRTRQPASGRCRTR